MKRRFIILVAAFLFCGSLQMQAQDDSIKLYFSEEEMPDLIKCLPPPPDTIGVDFAHDILRYMWGKTQRSDSARAAIAYRDAVWNYDSLFAEFDVPFGLKISKEGTPEIYKYLVNSLSTIDQTRVVPKAFYHRKRPFVVLRLRLQAAAKQEGGKHTYKKPFHISGCLILDCNNTEISEDFLFLPYFRRIC